MVSLAALWAVTLLNTLPSQMLDPRTPWRTLHSPRFRVHYPEGLYDSAAKVAHAAEHAFDIVIEPLDWEPATPIDIVLNIDTDGANGFAQTQPYNLVQLNLVAPDSVSQLAEYDDWLYELVLHELTHIVHIDTVGGPAAWLNALLGRQFFPNAVQPRWVVEGLATHFETHYTAGGRVGSAFFEMLLRMAVLTETPMQLDELSAAPLRWPQGTAQYLYGAYFMSFIADHYGADALRVMSKDYARNPIPFAINASILKATGKDYPTLYDEFLEALQKRFSTQRDTIEAAGVIQGELLTRRGQNIGPMRAAADGSIYFVEFPIGDHAEVRVITPEGKDQAVCWINPVAALALHPDGNRALLAQREVYSIYKNYGDFFEIDLQKKHHQRASAGLRVREPDISLDGREVVYAQTVFENSVLRIAPYGNWDAAETLVDLGRDANVWTPRFSQDGSKVVFSGSVDGHRNIYLWDRDAAQLQQLTYGRAVDGAPVFSADGQWIIFHSNRDGIFNLYAVSPHGGAARRLTRLLGGAFNPEPTRDGAAIIYQHYGPDGFDLARLASASIDKAERVELEQRMPPRVQYEQVGTAFPATGYNPLPGLWPRAWTPLVRSDSWGPAVGVNLLGRDPVGHHQYTLDFLYHLPVQFPAFAVSYANAQFHPGVRASGARQLGITPLPAPREATLRDVTEDVWLGRLSSTLPLFRSRDIGVSVSAAYELSLRRPMFDNAGDDQRFATLTLGFAYSDAQFYVNSISPEDGGRLNWRLSYESPWVGSEFESWSTVLDGAYFLENPWVQRHVLAGFVRAGYGQSNYRARRLFLVSGVQMADPLMGVLTGNASQSGALRGMPVAPLVGNVLLEGHLEYRFPVWDIFRGISTLPIRFGALHAAVFSDAAALADSFKHPWMYAVTAGAELRLNIVLGYYIPLTMRLGYGRAMWPLENDSFYFVLGNAP